MNRARTNMSRGFSLVEVLMAVLILALGMLGLGALLPAVVQQQRNGADATFSTLAAQNAQLYLSSSQSLPTGFWTLWANTRTPAAEIVPDDGSWRVVPVDPTTGELRPGYDLANFNAATHTRVAIADRLFPSDSANGNEPLFVWDMAVRRMQPRQPANQVSPPGATSLQAAIFIRRIDGRIRVNNNQSLFKLLTDFNAGDRRWPVAAELATGLPTLDGRLAADSRYSTPLTARLQISPVAGSTRSDVVVLTTSLPAANGADVNLDRAYGLISQRGQQLVDQLGNILTVYGPDPDTGPYAIKLSTPLDPALGGFLNVVYTPQVPAGIVLMKVTQ